MDNRYHKKILVILMFCFAVWAGDRILAVILTKIVQQSQFRFSSLYRGGRPGSIVVLGNSRAVNMIYAPDTESELKTPVFNLGFNSQSMEQAEALLLDYLEHNDKPSMVIIELTCMGGSDRLLDNFKFYCKNSSRFQDMLTHYKPKTALFCKISHLYAFNNQMFLRSLYYLNRSDQNWINQGQISQTIIDSIPNSEIDEPKFKTWNQKALARIIKISEESNIPLRLVVAPYVPEYFKRFPNFSKWLNNIEDTVGTKHRIWNYTTTITDMSCFADRIHTNKKGSKVLLDILINDGFYKPYSVAAKNNTEPLIFK